MATTDLKVELCTSIGSAQLKQIADMVNKVYTVAESDLWVEGHMRTNIGRIEKMIVKKQLITVENDRETIGCVRVENIGDGIARFGMLAVPIVHEGNGYGSLLVQKSESVARDWGCGIMQLELLCPKEIDHRGKIFLEKWYKRIGYEYIRDVDFNSMYPKEEKNLMVPCYFSIYHKIL